MMDAEILLRWFHVIGAAVLLGTGAGIAFFMEAARRSGNLHVIAGVAKIVVLADFLFTATAVVAQPVTGALLAHTLGWSLGEGWIVLSLILYAITGVFWLPVVWIQIQLRDMAIRAAKHAQPLPARFERLYRIWYWCGFPAFISVLAILWLMLAKPAIGLP
jgi:uncharacterized membrane protein